MNPMLCMVCNDKKKYESEISQTKQIVNQLSILYERCSTENSFSERKELLRQLKMYKKHPHFMCGHCFRINLTELSNLEDKMDELLVSIVNNIKEKNEIYYSTLRLLSGGYNGKYHVFQNYCLRQMKGENDYEKKI